MMCFSNECNIRSIEWYDIFNESWKIRDIAIFETYFICNISHFALYSAGGLVTAVAPVVIDCKGQWIGWTGLDDFNEVVDTIPESDPDDKAPTAGLLSKQVILQYCSLPTLCFSILTFNGV